MNVSHAALLAETNRLAEASGIGIGVAALKVMTLGVMAMARELPESLRYALALACERWYAGATDAASLQAASVDCWDFLEAKHGTSTVIADRTDAAVRALICVLWDEVPGVDEVDMTLEFFAPLAGRFGGIAEAMGLGL